MGVRWSMGLSLIIATYIAWLGIVNAYLVPPLYGTARYGAVLAGVTVTVFGTLSLYAIFVDGGDA